MKLFLLFSFLGIVCSIYSSLTDYLMQIVNLQEIKEFQVTREVLDTFSCNRLRWESLVDFFWTFLAWPLLPNFLNEAVTIASLFHRNLKCLYIQRRGSHVSQATVTSRVRCRVPSNNQLQTNKLKDLRHHRQKKAAKIGTGHHFALGTSIRAGTTTPKGGGWDHDIRIQNFTFQ